MSAVEAETGVQDHPRVRAKRPRSAVTSGRKAFIAGDPNSAWARRFHDLVQGHISDLGGRSIVSEARFALCKRAAGLECELPMRQVISTALFQQIRALTPGTQPEYAIRSQIWGLFPEFHEIYIADDAVIRLFHACFI